MGHVILDRFARLIAVLVIALAPMACVLHCRAAAVVDARRTFDTAAMHFLHSAPGDVGGTHGAHTRAPLNDILQLVKAVTQWLPAVAIYAVTLVAIARLAPRAQPSLIACTVAPAIPPPRERA